MIQVRTQERDRSDFDERLMDPEGFVVASLQADDRKRKRKWLWLSFVSTALLVAIGLTVAASSGTPVAAADTSEKTAEGWKLWRARKLGDAELTFLDALRLNEDDADAWNGVGWCRNNSGRHEKAITAFRKCLELKADHGAAINGIGQSSLALHDWKEAEKWLHKGSTMYLEQVPEERISATSLPAAWFGLVQVYLMTEQYAEAEEWASRILKYKSDDAMVKGFLQQARAKDNSPLKQRFEEVRDRVQQSKSWKNLSHGRPQEAIAGFRKILDESPDNIGALNGLAFALLNSGNHKEAKPLFEKCLKQNPKHYGAVNGLARCLHSSGQTDEAIKLWEQMCADLKGPNAGSAALGRIYLERKEYEKAIPYLKSLSEVEGPAAAAFRKMLTDAEKGLAESR